MERTVNMNKKEEFIKILDKHNYAQLPENKKVFLKKLFPVIDEKETITCKKVKGIIKPDIEITYNNLTYYVSVKWNKANLIHEEDIKQFIIWLRKYNISIRTQQTLLLYQYGDRTMDGTGSVRLTDEQITILLKNRIQEANAELNNNQELVRGVINRCLFKGSNVENIPADYIYHENKSNFVLVDKEKIFEFVKNNKMRWDQYDFIHIGPLKLYPHARYISTNVRYPNLRKILNFAWLGFSNDLRAI